jgi:hypothetical protein
LPLLPNIHAKRVNTEVVRHIAEFVGGLGERSPGPQIRDIDSPAVAVRHGAAASAQANVQSHALAQGRVASLLVRELCLLGVFWMFCWLTIEQRIAKANVGIVRVAILGEFPQRAQ